MFLGFKDMTCVCSNSPLKFTRGRNFIIFSTRSLRVEEKNDNYLSVGGVTFEWIHFFGNVTISDGNYEVCRMRYKNPAET